MNKARTANRLIEHVRVSAASSVRKLLRLVADIILEARAAEARGKVLSELGNQILTSRR